jgi:tRNA uridine 5-carboxymethylaminomethyl modification enzyme
VINFPIEYDVVVIGGGHAGIEAALAASRIGASVLLLSQNLDTIGQMSCNPAIGGLAKGHMVREIDALGGFMGLNADATAIQFRLLNASKGPSVRAPRAQCDKKAYQFRAKAELENTIGVSLLQCSAEKIIVDSQSAVTGIETNLGVRITTKTVVVTTGTFLKGLLHVGMIQQRGGRMGDPPSSLSVSLRELGFEISRFKTGTPCRLNARTINFGACEIQEGDQIPQRFSFLSDQPVRNSSEQYTLNTVQDGVFHVEQIPCWITYTNAKTHQIILSNLHSSPMYSGRIEGIGPRYCPSIEDKVVRFAEKERHQIFLEPEGHHTREYYVNGVSTSLPLMVQYEFIHSIPGLEKAEIIRPGYAVEYDYCPPTQLYPTLETKTVENLFFAGQINGTSGYEEAAAQGIIAGANAALKVKGACPLLLKRDSSYIGVMIDDLVTKGITEPYRMFTSRAEYRLLLRHDTADLRLTPLGTQAGLITAERNARLLDKISQLSDLENSASKIRVGTISLQQFLSQKEGAWKSLPFEQRQKYADEIWQIFENNIRYEGYIRREQEFLARDQKLENVKLPVGLDFSKIKELRAEARQRLSIAKPLTLGQARRVIGITPADIAVLAIELRRHGQTQVQIAQEAETRS